MILLDTAQKMKWARLVDNGKFKSANVGRASPIPTILIRVSSTEDALKLRQDINSGKIKKKGAQYFLVIGPQCLRWLLPAIKEYITKSYDIIKIITDWLNLLDDNTNVRNEKLKNNRRKILELKDDMLKYNRSKNSKTIESAPNYDVGILRAELAIYMKMPIKIRSQYIQKQIEMLLEKIAMLDENGVEYKFLNDLKVDPYVESVESTGT